MDIIKQDWFWTGTFSIISLVIGSLSTILVIYLKELTNRKTQIKLEKLKLYDEKRFKAYLDLYEFISTAYSYYWPPDEPRRDFVALMKNSFFTKIRIHYPYLKKDIREKLKILESQYECLGDPDFVPNIPFDQFIKTDYLTILNELNSTVEKVFDEWERS
jgi:hypothetical protein